MISPTDIHQAVRQWLHPAQRFRCMQEMYATLLLMYQMKVVHGGMYLTMNPATDALTPVKCN